MESKDWPKELGLPQCTHLEAGLCADTMAKHRKEMADIVARKEVPGFAQLLMHRGRICYFDQGGCADTIQNTPFAPDTFVRLFSMTKPLTVVALLALADEGKLSLDDSVCKYIPDFRNLKIVSHGNQSVAPSGCARAKSVTLRQLLMHTSGLSYGPFNGYEPKYACERSYSNLVSRIDDGAVSDLATFVAELAALPLRFAPGERWEYSHGMDVIGRVLEVVENTSLDKVLHRHIFEPLKMQDTRFYVPKEACSRLSALYKKDEQEYGTIRIDGGLKSAWVDGQQCAVLAGGGFMGSNSKTSEGSASIGGAISTLQDYLRFVMTLANAGVCPRTGYRLLREETNANMMKDWLRLPSVCGKSKIKGWDDAGRGHCGWCPLGQAGLGQDAPEIWMGGVAGTFFAIDSARDLVCVHTCQVAEAYDYYGEKLWEAAKEAMSKGPKVAPPMKVSPTKKVVTEAQETPLKESPVKRRPASNAASPMKRPSSKSPSPAKKRREA